MFTVFSPRSQTTSLTPNLNGRRQQLIINGNRILDEAHLHQLQHEGDFIMSSLL